MTEQEQNFLAILKEELIPAMGCTEPIALAYASAISVRSVCGRPIRRSFR
jgi:L-cysteine desulfidase